MSSVRKDVEDTFGALKRRFRILRVPSMFFNEGDITNMFKTCCILHNMLLDWDGLAGTGQQDEDWIADDKLDLTTMLEEVRKRREDLKKARNPNYRGAPAHPVDSVRISCTITCTLPVNGTNEIGVYI